MDLICPIATVVFVAFLVAVMLQARFGAPMAWMHWVPFRAVWVGHFLSFRQNSLVRAAVSHLCAITNLNLPLSQALTITAQSERGRLRRLLRDLGKQVGQGLPLSAALRRAEPACPRLITSMIAAGEQAGRLPQALGELERMLEDDLHDRASDPQNAPRAWLYPVAILVATGMILTWIMVIVMPKYAEIFTDFEADLPRTTVNLITAAQWATGGAGLAVWATLFLVLIAAPALIALSLRKSDESMTEAIVDTCGWIPGLTRPIAFGKGMSIALGTLHMGLTAGMTLPAAAELAASLRVNRYLRRRWEYFGRTVLGGTLASQAARDAELGNVFVWACRSLERGQADTQLVLRHAADYHRAMAGRWWRALSRVMWPGVTCLLGCVVGYVVLALFLPLVTLIDSVAEVAW